MIQDIRFKILAIGYVIVAICLFFYSFTQVDLGLTLSQWSYWQVFQKFFQHIGYFDRPLSTGFYITIITLLFIFYGIFLYKAHKNILKEKSIWKLIFVISTILFFAYNAFSYDLFNYIFDAKIVTFYHQNPYQHRAFDYPGNPMLGFMHWTERTYPYGPVWLLATIPFSFSGFRLLLPTIMLFKGIEFVSFLGTVFFLEKILQKISPQNVLFGTILFAFNPLVLIEGLVSAHNDMFMMFLGVFSLYLLIQKKYAFSFLTLLLSIGVKFATVFLIPIYGLIEFFILKKKKINYELIFLITTAIMILPVIFATLRITYQPWYLLYVLPFAALSVKKYFIVIPVFVMSLFSLFDYIPFLYTGNWNTPIPTILFYLHITGIFLSLFFSFIFFLRRSSSNVLQ